MTSMTSMYDVYDCFARTSRGVSMKAETSSSFSRSRATWHANLPRRAEGKESKARQHSHSKRVNFKEHLVFIAHRTVR